MELGLNHPRGPLAWGDAIGLDHVLAVLDALRVERGEQRYRAAPLLRRLVLEGRLGRRDRSRLPRVLARDLTRRPPRRVLPAVTPPPFQRFLDEQRDAVWRFLVAAVGRDAADDCFQETFLAALRAYPKLRDASNLRAWVLTIAHRKAIDHHRARRRGAGPGRRRARAARRTHERTSPATSGVGARARAARRGSARRCCCATRAT